VAEDVGELAKSLDDAEKDARRRWRSATRERH
jgi:hypothetical protein